MNVRAARVIRWAVALGVIGLLVAFVDIGSIGARLAGTDPRLAAAGVAGLVAVHLIAAGAWRRLLRDLAGISIGWGTTLRLYYAAQALGTVTPANLGADAYRVFALGGPTQRGRLAQPVIVQRLTSVIAIVCLGTVGAVTLPIGGLGGLVVAAVAAGGLLVSASVVLVRPSTRPSWLRRFAERLHWDAVEASDRGRTWSVARDGFGLGLVFHGASLLLGLILVRAVDQAATADPWLVLGALAVARMSLAIPVTPNGFGLQEGLLAVLFVQLGLPADTAIAAALLNRLAFLATAALGGVSLLAPVSPATMATVERRPAPRVAPGARRA